MDTKLDKLLHKEAQLKAQIQLAKAAERTLEKKRDTRRKILIGAAVMARVDSERWPKADLLEMMDGFLTRPNERDLFDLDEVDGEAVAVSAKSKLAKAGEKADKKSEGTVSTSQKKAAKASSQKASDAASKLSEPDFDVDKEFNL